MYLNGCNYLVLFVLHTFNEKLALEIRAFWVCTDFNLTVKIRIFFHYIQILTFSISAIERFIHLRFRKKSYAKKFQHCGFFITWTIQILTILTLAIKIIWWDIIIDHIPSISREKVSKILVSMIHPCSSKGVESFDDPDLDYFEIRLLELTIFIIAMQNEIKLSPLEITSKWPMSSMSSIT